MHSFFVMAALRVFLVNFIYGNKHDNVLPYFEDGQTVLLKYPELKFPRVQVLRFHNENKMRPFLLSPRHLTNLNG